MKGCVCTYPDINDKKCKHCGFFELSKIIKDNTKLKEENNNEYEN